jgi:hypothetical protein
VEFLLAEMERFYTAKGLEMQELVSFHPEPPDEKLLVSDSERRDFSSWQGNRGVARRRTSVRRTSKPEG